MSLTAKMQGKVVVVARRRNVLLDVVRGIGKRDQTQVVEKRAIKNRSFANCDDSESEDSEECQEECLEFLRSLIVSSSSSIDTFDALDRNAFPRIANHIDLVSPASISTPLHYAAARGTSQCVALLLNAGANINARASSGSSALQHAVRAANFGTVKTLLVRGADVSVLDNDGNSLAHLAVCHNSVESLKFFLALEPSLSLVINKYGLTAAQQAAQRGLFHMVEWLTAAAAFDDDEQKKTSKKQDQLLLASCLTEERQDLAHPRSTQYQFIALRGSSEFKCPGRPTGIVTRLTESEFRGMRQLAAFEAGVAPAVAPSKQPWFAARKQCLQAIRYSLRAARRVAFQK